MRGRRIAQHDFGHQLRPAVGRGRHRRIVLGDGHAGRIAIDRRGRGKNEMTNAALDRSLNQGAGVGGVVAVIAERIPHRVRHDGRAGEMDDRFDLVIFDQSGDQRLVADVTDDRQHRCGQGRSKTGRQVVEHNDALTRIRERMHGVASDITCAAGDQDGHRTAPFAGASHTGSLYKAGYCGPLDPDKWPACLMPGICNPTDSNEASMPDVLFIKTSSLGDVIHHMPALTEARARRPDARYSWVVEEAFAPLVALHPAVSGVIPIAARNWRRTFSQPSIWPSAWRSTWRDIASFWTTTRARHFDE